MKKLILLLLGTILSLSTNAQDFTYEYEGQTLKYTVLSETDKTCEVVTQLPWLEGDIYIPDAAVYESKEYKVTSIDIAAFYSLNYLTSVNIPASVTTIGKAAFVFCRNLTSINVDVNNPSYCSVDGVLYDRDMTKLIQCPATFVGEFVIPNSVCSIEYGAFAQCSGLTSIEIPNSVTEIGEQAFSVCSNLTSIVIPNSVSSLGSYALNSCSNLKSVEILAPLTKIEDYTFNKCSSLVSVNIPNTVISIGDYAFSGCRSLSAINIPDEVTSIGDVAFQSCIGLTSIKIPSAITSFGYVPFFGCESLVAVYYDTDDPKEFPFDPFDAITYYKAILYVPEGAEEKCQQIDPWKNFRCINGIFNYDYNGASFTFKITGDVNKTCSVIGCDSYDPQSVHVPAFAVKDSQEYEVTSIGDEAFEGLTMRFFNLPTTIKTIGNRAFCGCDELLLFILPDAVTSVGDESFANCSRLQAVNFGESILSIGDRAFVNCTDLSYAYLSKTVNYIGEQAFRGCDNMEAVYIPGSVTSIGDFAFAECGNLTAVQYATEDPLEFNNNIFDDVAYSSATLYIPEGVAEKCRQLDPWKNFKSLQQYEGLDDILADDEMEAPCEVFNLSGVKIGDSTEGLEPGLYIVRQGSSAKKIMVK